MLPEIEKLVKEFLSGTPYIVSRQTAVLVSGVRLIFPLHQDKVKEFVRILNGAQTPGWDWEATMIPLVFLQQRKDFQGNWGALEVSRKALRRA